MAGSEHEGNPHPNRSVDVTAVMSSLFGVIPARFGPWASRYPGQSCDEVWMSTARPTTNLEGQGVSFCPSPRSKRVRRGYHSITDMCFELLCLMVTLNLSLLLTQATEDLRIANIVGGSRIWDLSGTTKKNYCALKRWVLIRTRLEAFNL